jgi:uncharacterized damage-inducible protein DinB
MRPTQPEEATMSDVTTLETLRALYAYHWWANRRLFELTTGLGEEAAGRDIGKQFSFPTLRGMLAHLYGADFNWLARWKGQPTGPIPGGDIPTLSELRLRWEILELEQRAFVEALTPADLSRVVAYKSLDGKPLRVPLWPLLQHVPNHATHHRSELATMITMISGSPPDTGILTFHLAGASRA